MSPQSSWILQEEIAPRLRSAIPNNVNRIGSEDAQELIQDSICMAAKLLTNAELANKSVTPGNIAYYTILHMKSGRRSYGAQTVDVLVTGTQLNGRSTTTSFDEVVDGDELGEEFTVNDVFSNDAEDPSQIAARKLDWDAFLTGLSEREKLVVENLLAGRNMSEIARVVKLDPTTIHNYRNKLAVKILDYKGPDILR
jgi:hypothetical protein